MKKSQDRKQAEAFFLQEKGRITNKEIGHKLGVHAATIARWRKLDSWDITIQNTQTEALRAQNDPPDNRSVDKRHIESLNQKMSAYLQRENLLPIEIMQLAQAKYFLMDCDRLLDDNAKDGNTEPGASLPSVSCDEDIPDSE